MRQRLAIWIPLITVFVSCQHDPFDPTDFHNSVLRQITWDSVALDNHRQVWDFHGSIDTVLFVASGGSIFKTENRGATWNNVHTIQHTIFDLRIVGDTLFGITYYSKPNTYTTDNGASWHAYVPPLVFPNEIDTLTDRNVKYRVQNTWSDGPYPIIESAKILETRDNGQTWIEIFHTQGYIARLYNDDEYIYVSTNKPDRDQISFYLKRIED